jgi:hypothetical protein
VSDSNNSPRQAIGPTTPSSCNNIGTGLQIPLHECLTPIVVSAAVTESLPGCDGTRGDAMIRRAATTGV